jgi:cell division GTPase FtsZ
MPGKKPTSKALQPKWQATNRPADAIQHAKPKILIIGIGSHGKKTINQLTPQDNKNIQTTTITTKTQKTTTDKLAEANTILLITNLADKKEEETTTKITQIAKTKGIKTAAIVANIQKNNTPKLTELKQQWDTTILVNDKTLTKQLPNTTTEEIRQLQQKASAKIIENIIKAITTPNQENPDTTHLKTPTTKETNRQILQPDLPTITPKETTPTHINIPKATTTREDQLENLAINPQNIELNNNFTVTIVTAEDKKPTVNLSLIAPQLANMETYSKTRQKLQLDLNLHQMENF